MKRSLDQVLADARGDAARLRFHGHTVQAESLEHLCDDVAEAAIEYLTWLTEDEAMRRSNRARAWFRARFSEWERAGHARHRGRAERLYRMLVVPQRANASAAYHAGRQAGRRRTA